MNRFLHTFVFALVCLGASVKMPAAEATFFRAINLNGTALTVDGHLFEASGEAKDFTASGKNFENQKVPLRPPTDPARSQMIRSSIWGNKVEASVTNVPAGQYQVFLYVWEDNNNERFDLLVNGAIVQEAFESGSTGVWNRLGPWKCESVDGKIAVAARGPSHGAANLSGLEIWAGNGPVPMEERQEFTSAPNAEQLAFFEAKIRPVLVERCYECHSAKAEKVKGGLLLDSRSGLIKGGDTGPAVKPGDLDASLLITAIRHEDKDLAMPKKKLPPEQIADFEAWVTMGAPDPRTENTVAAVQAKSAIDWTKAREWWSFRPLTLPPLPAVKDESWAKNELDRFVLAKLEEASLKPAGEADRRALIRRATYDLIGLPPTPEEVDAFVKDEAPDAFAKVVDRLLASPRYGERWGRHWMDVVRYADTAGDNSDYPVPQMHRYRDWVISMFNRDLPYDEFVRDQIAGDLRGGDSDEQRYERIIATGYIANARRFGSRVEDYPQHLTIEDTIDSLGRTFLGLSVNCARCHDHKFDPISQQDYYAIYGIFNSTRYPWPGIELEKKQRDLIPLVPAHDSAAALEQIKSRSAEQKQLEKAASELKEKLKKVPQEEKARVEAEIKEAEKAVRDHASKPLAFELAYAVADAGKISDATVQVKGDPAKPGPLMRRHFLTVFGGHEVPAGDKSSGRERLAEWILAKDNPLPARVMANRIWQHHFGRGIVPTPNDFGKQGKPASHPELLDFLAANFRDGGWSIKAMHRLIMLSRTYQLSTIRNPGSIAQDPSNLLLSSFPRLRLDAESIRDTLLALGRNLDLSPAGAHPFPPEPQWDFTQHKPFKAIYETNRRSVFLMTQRIQRHPYLAIFDGADPSTSTPARPTSTTPVQALYLLNNSFVHEQAQRLAEALCEERSDNTARISRAYELAFARPPAEEESQLGLKFLSRARAQLTDDGISTSEAEAESWRAYVRSLFRLNEFVYLD